MGLNRYASRSAGLPLGTAGHSAWGSGVGAGVAGGADWPGSRLTVGSGVGVGVAGGNGHGGWGTAGFAPPGSVVDAAMGVAVAPGTSLAAGAADDRWRRGDARAG